MGERDSYEVRIALSEADRKILAGVSGLPLVGPLQGRRADSEPGAGPRRLRRFRMGRRAWVGAVSQDALSGPVWSHIGPRIGPMVLRYHSGIRTPI